MDFQHEAVVDFTTHQTDSMFILTSDLKKGSYGRKDIKIEINEDGSRMTIIGESRKGFHKTFIIPEGVDLDKVKARFDQHQSRLTVRMPKLVKGMVAAAIGIQESKHPVPDQQNHNADEEITSTELKQEPRKQDESESREQDDEKMEEEKTYATPIIAVAAGSTLFVSLILVFFTFIRSKNQSTKKPT